MTTRQKRMEHNHITQASDPINNRECDACRTIVPYRMTARYVHNAQYAERKNAWF